MKFQLTIVVRDGVTWKEVRKALIRTTNQLSVFGARSVDLTDTSDAPTVRIYDGPTEDATQIGRWALVPDEDEF